MRLQNLTDVQLIDEAKRAVALEVSATTNVVRLFCEVYTRELYLQLGYGSMFLFATQELGYDRASAQRRVNAMELALAIPSVLETIERRELCLQSVADLQTFFNIQRGKKNSFSADKKLELVEKCTGLSTRQVQIELASLDPALDFKFAKKLISRERVQITYSSANALEEKLEKIKALLSHINPYMTREEILDYVAEMALEKLDPVRKAARAETRVARKKIDMVPAQELPSNNARVARSNERPIQLAEEIVSEAGEIQLVAVFENSCTERRRYIKAADADAVWKRNLGGGCEYVDAVSGRRCGSEHQLQRDHVQAYSRGGTNEAANLQILCAKHNRFLWRRASVVRCAVYDYVG